MERSVGDVRFTWVDPAITRGHHDLSHDGDSDRDTVEMLTKINVWYTEQFAYLIDALKKIPEGNGTMLDNTLILWCNELRAATRTRTRTCRSCSRDTPAARCPASVPEVHGTSRTTTCWCRA